MAINIKSKITAIKPLVFVICFVLSVEVNAEVVFDGTAGPSGALAGPTYNIDASFGTQAGGNLFHSFSTFNVNTGETANFNGPADVTNVIGRVTGGNFSNIDGTINNNISGANLWLVNPAGIVFGSNATLNVSGSFHASTGDSVLFDDNSSFDTVSQNDPSLIVANPVGFGFVSASPGSIVVNNANLRVGSGQTLSLVGGAVSLNGSTLGAIDGRLNIAAVNGPGDVTFSNPKLSTESGISYSGTSDTLANINISSTTLDTSGDGGGAIYIRGGQFVLDPGSTIKNDNVNTDGRVVHISANDVTLNEGLITSNTIGAAQGGDIVVQGNNLSVAYDEATSSRVLTETGLVTQATGTGNGGKIDIDVTNSVTLDGGIIRTFAQNTARGGDVDINGADLKVNNNGKIFSSTLANGGTSGSINIDTSNSVSVAGADSKIEAQTVGNADASHIDVNITTGDLTITDGAQVSTDSFSAGLGAGINITADSMTVSNQGVVNARTFDDTGAGIDIDLTDNLNVISDGSISTDTFNNGDGSTIAINANNVAISDGGQISASTKRDGQAGAITLNATDSVTITGTLDKQTGLFSVSGDPDPNFQPATGVFSGNGGEIALNADRLVIENGGVISAEAINLGDAGDINLSLSDELLMSNSRIVTSATQSAGGEVNIQALNLVSLFNSDITAEAFGVSQGNDGGNVFIDPVNVALNSSDLVARANAGNGGNITVRADAFLRSPGSNLDATSRTGVDGEVSVETLNQNVNVIPVVTEPFLDVAGLLSNRCAAQVLKSKSSFTVELYKSAAASLSDFSYYRFFAADDYQNGLAGSYILAGAPAVDLGCI